LSNSRRAVIRSYYKAGASPDAYRVMMQTELDFIPPFSPDRIRRD
jgi:hypothetical protein